MAQLLELTEAETEEFLSQMVVSGAVQAKTDRLEGIVSFIKVSSGHSPQKELCCEALTNSSVRLVWRSYQSGVLSSGLSAGGREQCLESGGRCANTGANGTQISRYHFQEGRRFDSARCKVRAHVPGVGADSGPTGRVGSWGADSGPTGRAGSWGRFGSDRARIVSLSW